MLDTLRLSLDRYEVQKDNGLTVQRNFVRGEEQDLRSLFPLVGGGVESGSKAYLNTEHLNLTVQRFANKVQTSLQFSVPKVASGSNYLPACGSCYEKALEIIESDLHDAGIETSILDARLQRVDITRNASLTYPVNEYAPVWQLLNGSRLKDKLAYPSGYQLKNTVRQVVFYDKVEEMRKKKHETAGMLPNVMRAEVRALDARTSSRMLELQTAGDLLKNFERVPVTYKTVMNGLFQFAPKNLQDVALTHLERVFRAEQIRGNRYWITRAVQQVGAHYILFALGGDDALRKLFRNLGQDRPNVTRSVKKILEMKRDFAGQEELFGASFSRTTVGELYEELKYRFVA